MWVCWAGAGISLRTYLKELKTIRSCQLFQELDASDRVIANIDTDKVLQVSKGCNVPNAVIWQLELLQMLIAHHLLSQVFNRWWHVLHLKESEGIWATVYIVQLMS